MSIGAEKIVDPFMIKKKKKNLSEK